MVPERVVQLPGDAEALLARAPAPLLLRDQRRLDRSLPPDPHDLSGAEEHEEPGGERQEGGERRGGAVPERVVEPREDDEADARRHHRDRAMPPHDGADVGDDESEPDRTVRVTEQEVDERDREGGLEDRYGMEPPPREHPGGEEDQQDPDGVESMRARLAMR